MARYAAGFRLPGLPQKAVPLRQPGCEELSGFKKRLANSAHSGLPSMCYSQPAGLLGAKRVVELIRRGGGGEWEGFIPLFLVVSWMSVGWLLLVIGWWLVVRCLVE